MPTQQPTIQAAIDAAQPGDEVRVGDGSSGITIQDNKTSGASTGIAVANIFGTSASEMYVLDNVVKKPDGRGIEVYPDVLGAVVQGNKIKNSQGNGMIIRGSLCQVIANTVKKAKKYGVEADDRANTFSGNVATGSGDCDLYDHESKN